MGIDAEMLVRVKGHPSQEQIKIWAWKLAKTIGPNNFFLDKEEGHGALYLAPSYDSIDEDGKLWEQDGPTLHAEKDETFLRVNLWTRYYGIGYERGDILLICNIAEWCEVNIPNCEVWYGGDSSGVCVEPFPASKRAQLKAHLWSDQGRDYFEFEKQSTFPTPKPCSLCLSPPQFNRHGWGRGNTYIAVNCPGCGSSFESHDKGKNWTEKK